MAHHPDSYKGMNGPALVYALLLSVIRNTQSIGSTHWSDVIVMKELISKSFKFIPAALCLALALLANNAKAASSYWDIDGANPGAGGTTPDGSWEGAFWSTDSTGSSAT